MSEVSFARRQALAARGKRLEYFTLAWNSLEALATLVAGVLAGSIALVGFGLDSVIEVASGAALLWRMAIEADAKQRERIEFVALRTVGVCFLCLAVYISWEATVSLLTHRAPESSMIGIVFAAAALVAMPLLSKAKDKVGAELGSAAMRADAKQSAFCAYLSAVLLVGLLLNAWLGWWWTDPIAGILMVPFIAKEGIEGLRGKACCH